MWFDVFHQLYKVLSHYLQIYCLFHFLLFPRHQFPMLDLAISSTSSLLHFHCFFSAVFVYFLLTCVYSLVLSWAMPVLLSNPSIKILILAMVILVLVFPNYVIFSSAKILISLVCVWKLQFLKLMQICLSTSFCWCSFLSLGVATFYHVSYNILTKLFRFCNLLH